MKIVLNDRFIILRDNITSTYIKKNPVTIIKI